MLRVLIVDDEPLAIERLHVLCAAIEGITVVGSAADGQEAIQKVMQSAPDVLLLDIAMPGLDGIGVAEALDQMKSQVMVIYCTAFDHFAVAAFGVAAVDYLLKPVESAPLAKALKRAAEAARLRSGAGKPGEINSGNTFVEAFWVPRGAEMVRIGANSIDRVDAERDYMALRVGSKRYLLHMTFTELERRLDPTLFVRLHRSTLVRQNWISRLRHDGLGIWYARLIDESEVRIGRTYLPTVKALLHPPSTK